MSEVRTVTVRFHLEREADRRAYAFLQGKGKEEYHSLSRAVIAAVEDFCSRRERLTADPYLETREKEDTFLEKIEKAVEQGIRANALGNLSALLQNSAASLPAVLPNPETEIEESDLDEALDFVKLL